LKDYLAILIAGVLAVIFVRVLELLAPVIAIGTLGLLFFSLISNPHPNSKGSCKDLKKVQ
jgi:hypothetical protein